MIELGDESNRILTKSKRIRTCLRKKVPNMKLLADKLIKKNIEVDCQEHNLGTVAKFLDTDGNLWVFKDN